jgi:hypothetical protein
MLLRNDRMVVGLQAIDIYNTWAEGVNNRVHVYTITSDNSLNN